jgi:UDP-2-acetamido-2-deoxy-ribo-hexuluronate aminotransferase
MIDLFSQDNNTYFLKKIHNFFKNDFWVNGKIVSLFEKKIERKLKLKLKACSCNSGSDALLIALKLDYNKFKDIYITTPLSYIASSSIAKFLNLKIIYLDVSENNFLLDLNKLEEFLKSCPAEIKKRIKGVINVELFGATNNLQRLKKISKKYNLSLIGDCSQSFGTKYYNESSINFYDYAILSFYPTKIFSCYGDGGMILVKKKFYEKTKLLKNNGHDIFDKTVCKVLGINSRLDSLQAYILNNKLKTIDKIISKKKLFFDLLKKNLPHYMKLPILEKKVVANNYILSVYINKKIVKKFINYMNKQKIYCKIFYPKLLSKNRLLQPIIKNKLINAECCTETLVSLPSHNQIKLKDFRHIIKKINHFGRIL